MVDATISVEVERLAALLEEQNRYHVNLVRAVEKEIRSLSDELKTIRNVLDDAEKKGCKDKSVKDWLMRLEDTAYELDDVLDEWNMAILKLDIEQHSNPSDVTSKKKVWSFIPTSCIRFKKLFAIRRDIILKIKEVKARLDQILAEKDQYGFVTSRPINPSCESCRVHSTSLIDLEEVFGREIERENLVSKLVVEGGNGEELGIQVLFVVGVAGLGKTTLAKLAYNDSRVKSCFELRIWICVSDSFDVFGIANGIIEGAGRSKPNTNQLEMVLHCLEETISGKKILIVLDDVWTEDESKWEPLKQSLKCGGAGSKIMVTTRNERDAKMMGNVKNEIHHLGFLSLDECWLLVGRIALSGKKKEEREKFENIGKNIAKKCKGLPLAAKILGSLLHFKNTLEEWENVLSSEIWELEEVEIDLFPHLLLSYNELSPTLKRCFSYCAVFPKDTEIDVESLVVKWMAMGYLGSSDGDWRFRGREYFNKLVTRSLFQDFEKGVGYDHDELIKSFKMHGIIHDFAQFVRKNGRLVKQRTCQTCSALIVSRIKEYHSLFHQKELPDPHLCDGLTSLRLLSLRKCGLQNIPKEIEKLIHLRWLDLGCNKFPDEDLKTICKLYNLQFLWVDECELQEIPREIGNLIQLIQLDMSSNKLVKELPQSICNLRELESLNIGSCGSLARLPKGINRLVNLKHLYNSGTDSLEQYPQGLAELTSLVTLSQFGSKLGWLKNLNRLTGSLKLTIELSDDLEEEVVVEDAREAELGRKMQIKEMTLCFADRKVKDSVWMDLIDALEPHQNVRTLSIQAYKGSQLPRWISTPLNQLKSITLIHCKLLTSLPPLGKLPVLDNVTIWNNSQFEFVGRDFLGITTTTTTTRSGDHLVGFPKLKKLAFWNCTKWKEWEDITAEEEEDDFVNVMPCLTELLFINCECLTALPHRLLRKAASLKLLNIYCSTQLKRFYVNKEGQPWKSISQHNPHLELKHR